MKVRFLRFWVATVLRGRLYYLWSKVYQATFEKWAHNVELLSYKSVKALEETLGRMKWKRDGPWQLWDAIGGPKATYSKHLSHKEVGDCDEYALYAADRLRDMAVRGVLVDKGIKRDEIYVLTIPWVDLKGKAGGHNVCAFKYRDADGVNWAHVSNWYKGEVQWNKGSLKCVIREVLVGRTSLGWAIATPELKLVKYGNGKEVV